MGKSVLANLCERRACWCRWRLDFSSLLFLLFGLLLANFFTVVFCFTCWEQHLLISIALRTLACVMHVFRGSYGMLLLA